MHKCKYASMVSKNSNSSLVWELFLKLKTFGNIHAYLEIYFLFKIYFSLPYYCCTREMLWHLQKFLHCIIVEFTHSIIHLYPPFPPFLEQFQQVSFFHFHAWVLYISIIFTFYTHSSFALPFYWYQPLDRIVLSSSSPSLKKHILKDYFTPMK
jgi:hypothetical protein